MQLAFNGRDLELRASVTAAFMQTVNSMPGRKRWRDRVVVFEASRANVEHVLRLCEGVSIDATAQPVIAKLEQQRRDADQLHQLKHGPDQQDAHDYAYKTRPYAHQARGFKLSRDAKAFALFMEPGTGKTKVSIDTACWLYGKGAINALLIIAPNGVHTNWTEREIPAHLPDGVPVLTFLWQSSNASKRYLADAAAFMADTSGALRVLCMNVECFVSDRATDFATKFLLSARALMVLDESTRIKTPGALRTKAILKLGKLAAYRRILTGTPVTEGVENLFTQMTFLDQNILGFSSFYTFRNRYCIMGGFDQREIVGYQRMPELLASLEPFTYHVKKSECLDLPPKVYTVLDVELTHDQRRLYDQLRNKLVAEFKDGLTITSPHALTRLLRLQQIVCGWLATDDDGLVQLPSRRLAMLQEKLEDTPGSAIIWSRFVPTIREIAAALGKRCVTYYGSDDDEARRQAVNRFQDGSARWFVGNPQSGGIGLTLTAAESVVYYANDYSLERRLQSEDRAHRIGQTKTVVITDMVAAKTIDELIVKAHQTKQDVAQLVLSGL